jgi:peptidylprolyl isomerase
MECSSWLRQAKSNVSLVCAVLAVQAALSACSNDEAVVPQADREIVVTEREAGTGAVAQAGDTVLFHYVGYVSPTDEVFDNSYERGLPLEVIAGEKGTDKQSAIIKNNLEEGSVVTGLARGLVGVRVGGRRIISIPQELAYGGCNNAPEGVPELVCRADYLEFEVRVLAIRY